MNGVQQGAIQGDGDTVYPVKLFREITGFGDWAMRKARKSGLRVIIRGGRAFVKGSDFIRWIDGEEGGKTEQGGEGA